MSQATAIPTSAPRNYDLDELNRETAYGGEGSEDNSREIRLIDLGDFADRRQEIADELWKAATEIGFFQVYNHGIPQEHVDMAFAMSARFFDLPEDIKAKYPLKSGTNAGWEYKAQVRPSTGTADNKESYQLTQPRMPGLWPSDAEVDQFKGSMLRFEAQCWEVGMKILSCFAMKLGFPLDFFTDRHDPTRPEYQSTLRLLHYLPMLDAKPEDFKQWRAGAHTDFDCLTLLHQRPGHGGLQVCPGKERDKLAWTDVEPKSGVITCNIGDMLMRWSDDELQSTLHRVRMPKPGEPMGSRHSMAFFCQANTDAVIESPKGTYPKITARDYLNQRIAANFAK